MEDVAGFVGLVIGAAVVGLVLALLAHFLLFKRRIIWGTLAVGAAGSILGRVLPLKPNWLWMLVGTTLTLTLWWLLFLRRRSEAEYEPE